MANREKVVALVMARMSSSRFPGKVMADLNGKPLLQHIIERLKNSETVDKIVVVTTKTENQENLSIVELAKKLGVSYSYEEGSALDEFMKAARKHKADIIVRVTGDCPLISVKAMDRMVKFLKENNADYTHNRHKQGVPIGLHSEVVRMSAMEKVYQLAREKKHKDHITLYILENKNVFNIKNFAEDKTLQRPNVSLAVDKPADFDRINKILSVLGEDSKDYKKIINYIDNNPGLVENSLHDDVEFIKVFHHDL